MTEPALIEQHETTATVVADPQPAQQIIPFDAERLISKAIEQQTPIETMERLLAMRKELKAEAAREAFYLALSEFQADIPTIPKQQVASVRSQKGSYQYRYADLSDIQKTIAPTLKTHGLSVTFDTENEQGAYVISCIVHHRNGHSETTRFRVPIDDQARMNSTQKAGSALTYGRRYALTAALGIVSADADDDAQSLNEIQPYQPPAQPVQNQKPGGLSDKQLRLLGAKIKEAGADREAVKAWCKLQWGIDSSKDLNNDQLNQLLENLPVISFHQNTPEPSAQQAQPDDDLISSELLKVLDSYGWKPGNNVDDLQNTIDQIAEAAQSKREYAEHTDGPTYREISAEADHLRRMAKKAESRATQLLSLEPQS